MLPPTRIPPPDLSDPAVRRALREDFAQVEAWVFDLDNTLYPYTPGLWTEAEANMTAWIGDLLGLDLEEARKLQHAYLEEYGLTARGLAIHHGVDPVAFMAETHDHVPIETVAPDPALAKALAALPGRLFVHTNAHPTHAERLLKRVGIDGLFAQVFTVADLDHEPKPNRRAFELAAERGGYDPRRAAMFEDAARNLIIPHEMGMRTVYVPSPSPWAQKGADGPQIAHVAPDLTRFLQALTSQAD
ncbi:pyrimidine 5'-nucleotidase [Neomegalonema sp.]|uniref:pyrimidine 5'-nucleotidase n=1 Tax=Neomegalonema sp. TaxID=2039713 RepID=UPI002609ED3C|nr:pyrimidine 5'-nucleotidase [Neomegalonema sp.]MDD2867967.1 pyrimidine 5'-nucleotidase [Neomegalonema sp.]